MPLLVKASHRIGTSTGHYVINPLIKDIKGSMPYCAYVLKKFSIVVAAVRARVVQCGSLCLCNVKEQL